MSKYVHVHVVAVIQRHYNNDSAIKHSLQVFNISFINISHSISAIPANEATCIISIVGYKYT